eukprot:scaffold7410_cov59-Cylindrotheca_fusiformis.AAC.1
MFTNGGRAASERSTNEKLSVKQFIIFATYAIKYVHDEPIELQYFVFTKLHPVTALDQQSFESTTTNNETQNKQFIKTARQETTLKRLLYILYHLWSAGSNFQQRFWKSSRWSAGSIFGQRCWKRGKLGSALS